MTQLAVGFSSGIVVIIRGDLLRERNPRQKKIHQPKKPAPITGLGFRTNYQTKTTTLFVVSTDDVTAYTTSHDDVKVI
jgi:hypothetical protein